MKIEDAEILAELLIEKYLDGKGWTFKWNRRKVGFGLCRFGQREIQLSSINVPIESEDTVEQTLLHEIAHALVGYDQGHNRIWKAKARSIGVRNPKATRDLEDYSKAPEPAWVMVFGKEIIHRFYRKPGYRKFMYIHTFWARGRKSETLGNLKLISYNEFINS